MLHFICNCILKYLVSLVNFVLGIFIWFVFFLILIVLQHATFLENIIEKLFSWWLFSYKTHTLVVFYSTGSTTNAYSYYFDIRHTNLRDKTVVWNVKQDRLVKDLFLIDIIRTCIYLSLLAIIITYTIINLLLASHKSKQMDKN